MLSYRIAYIIPGMSIKTPPWYDALRNPAKIEQLRSANGLYPKDDGYYKSVGGKTRYVCKPCPVRDAVKSLEVKMLQWTGGGQTARKVQVNPATLTLVALYEMYIDAMLDRLRTGVPKKLARQTYDDLVRTLGDFVSVVGPQALVARMGPDDFTAYAKSLAGLAATSRRRRIQYVDMMVNWAGPGKRYKNMIPFLHRGPDWVKPSDEEIMNAAADADKAYSPAQLTAAFELVKGDPLLNAAAHLGLNGAFSVKDLGTLPESMVNLDDAEIRFARGKTGVARICPLLPETVQAVKDYLGWRKRFKTIAPAAEGLLFRTREGMPYDRHFGGDGQDAGHRDNLLGRRWGDVVHRPFGGLRSTFATHADDWKDQRAVDMVMGHKVGKVGRHIRRHYAKQFSVERARELVVSVWQRAFAVDARKGPSPAPAVIPPQPIPRSPSKPGSRAKPRKPRG